MLDAVRLLRVHNALRTLQEADYPSNGIPAELDQWVSAKDDSPGEIDRFVRTWQQWWTR